MIAREKGNRELRLKKGNLRNKRKYYISMLDQHQKGYSDLTESEKLEFRKKVEIFLKRDQMKTIILKIILFLLISGAILGMILIFFQPLSND